MPNPSQPATTDPALMAVEQLLVNLKGMVAKMFSLDETEISGIMTMRAMVPLMTEILGDPLLKTALVSLVMTPELKKSIEKYDTFIMLRDVKRDIKL